MTRHVIPRIRQSSLAAQLAGLGLVRVVAEQADPALRCWFEGSGLLIETTVDDLATWLVDSYVPMPVLNPWNDGSGFGPKDKASKAALRQLLDSPLSRLDDYRATHAVVAPLAAEAREKGWTKASLVAAVRNRCPDAMLPWLDTAVVLLDSSQLAFPPLLGSGGNDGRLEFSSNFHQRLLDVLPLADSARARSLTLVRDWLDQTSTQPLTRAAVGQFDPGAAGTPNSSPFGAAESLVNPWSFILMVEGAPLFASAPARRFDPESAASPRAAMTFMTFGSEAGSATATAHEDSRGEVWIPRWDVPLSFAVVRQIFSEGRAVWRGRTVTRSGQMYLAAASRGASPVVSAFERYMIVKRNGLAFSAVRADEIQTRSDDAMLLVAAVEDWPDSLRRADLPAGVDRRLHAFDEARVSVARSSNPASRTVAIRNLLSATTALEIAVGRSTRLRDDVRPRRPVTGEHLLQLLDEAESSPASSLAEFRVALGLASVLTQPLADAPAGRTLREVLLPIDPPAKSGENSSWRASAPVPGMASLPIVDVVARVVHWLMTARYAAAKPEHSTQRVHGVVALRGGVRVPWQDLHRWVRGLLDDGLIESWLVALLAFDWRGVRISATRAASTAVEPTLASVAPFRSGVGSEDLAEGVRYALTSEWTSRLLAGRLDQVHRTARSRLRQIGHPDVVLPVASETDIRRGRRIAAALLPASDTHTPLRLVSQRRTQPDKKGNPPPHTAKETP